MGTGTFGGRLHGGQVDAVALRQVIEALRDAPRTGFLPPGPEPLRQSGNERARVALGHVEGMFEVRDVGRVVCHGRREGGTRQVLCAEFSRRQTLGYRLARTVTPLPTEDAVQTAGARSDRARRNDRCRS